MKHVAVTECESIHLQFFNVIDFAFDECARAQETFHRKVKRSIADYLDCRGQDFSGMAPSGPDTRLDKTSVSPQASVISEKFHDSTNRDGESLGNPEDSVGNNSCYSMVVFKKTLQPKEDIWGIPEIPEADDDVEQGDESARTPRTSSASKSSPSLGLSDKPSERSSKHVVATVSPPKRSSIRDIDELAISSQNLFRKREEMKRQLTSLEEVFEDPRHRLLVVLDLCVAVIICLNILQIALSQDTYVEHELWSILEIVFISLYCTECALKWLMFGIKDYFAGVARYWNWFDFGLILISLVDLALSKVLSVFSGGNALGVLKLMRLCRLARLIRLIRLKLFDQLKHMIMGVIVGVKVLFWALVLLFCCFFLLGLIMRIILGDAEEETRTLPKAMFTAFHCFHQDCDGWDGGPLLYRLYDSYGWPFVCGYSLAFLFITVGVFNLIMATFIENVISSSEGRRLEELGRTRSRVFWKIEDTLEKLIFADADYREIILATQLLSEAKSQISLIDIKRTGSDILVSQDKFNQWLKLPEMQKLCEEAGIEPNTKDEWFDTLDADEGGQLNIDELMSGLMQLRGPITKTEIVAIRLRVQHVSARIELIVKHLGLDAEEDIHSGKERNDPTR